jgi:hypothetical protein
MRFDHDGLSLWYGTPDTPAPGNTVLAGAEIRITIGVQPPDASNRIQVLYRANQSPQESVTPRWLRSDAARRAQYFEARLGPFRLGDTVEYVVTCTCAGKTVPSREDLARAYVSFRVTDIVDSQTAAALAAPAAPPTGSHSTRSAFAAGGPTARLMADVPGRREAQPGDQAAGPGDRALGAPARRGSRPMHAVRSGLSLDRQGEDIADLHTAFDALDLGEQLPEDERAACRYGERTAELVRSLQHGLNVATQQLGTVDEATAAAINNRLFDQRVFQRVEGRVQTPAGEPVIGNLLVAFDRDNVGGASLGSANTNADGAYHIFYDPLLYARAGDGVLNVKDVIDLIVQVYDAGSATLAESPPLHDPAPKVRVALTIGDMPAGQSFILRGQVVDANGPMNGIQVSVFDRDLFFRLDGANNGQHLGTAVTGKLPTKNEDGCFEFTYRTSDFAAGDLLREGHTIPDLIFALSKGGEPLEKFQIYRLPDGKELAEETLVSDDDLILGIQSRRLEEVRILIPGGEPKPQMSEYERLWRAIEPLLPERAPEDADAAQRERLVCAAATRFDEEKHRDISFVARETGFDRSLIQALASAVRLAIVPFRSDLPASVFYGLARTRAASDVLALARLSTEDLRLALQKATADTPPLIPPFESVDRLEEAVQFIRNVLATHLPNYRPADGAPSLADLVGADLPNPDEQATLWYTYSDHVGTATDFWQKLQGQPGFEDPNKIARVQYTFQLGLLAQNNVSLMNAVRSQHLDVTDTGELAFRLDTPEKWTALLDNAAIPIPPDVPGLPEERKANYAASMGRRTADSPPHRHRRDHGRESAPDAARRGPAGRGQVPGRRSSAGEVRSRHRRHR